LKRNSAFIKSAINSTIEAEQWCAFGDFGKTKILRDQRRKQILKYKVKSAINKNVYLFFDLKGALAHTVA